VAVTLLLYPLHDIVDQTNIAMVFLAALVPVAMRLGRGPATLSAVLNVLGFDVFFVTPRFSLAVADLEYIVTFSVMLGVGLVIARLTGSLKNRPAKSMNSPRAWPRRSPTIKLSPRFAVP
jgi:two-component system sensor histidine kinase KdpD